MYFGVRIFLSFIWHKNWLIFMVWNTMWLEFRVWVNKCNASWCASWCVKVKVTFNCTFPQGRVTGGQYFRSTTTWIVNKNRSSTHQQSSRYMWISVPENPSIRSLIIMERPADASLSVKTVARFHLCGKNERRTLDSVGFYIWF